MARALADGAPLTVEAASTLHRLEHDDFCFPDLDPAWGRDPGPAPALPGAGELPD